MNVSASPPRTRRSRRARPVRRLSASVLLGRLALSLLALLWLLPVAWALDTSLKTEFQTILIPPAWVPTPVTLTAYGEVLQSSGLPRWYLNSAIVACATTALVLAFCSLGGYAFARLRFPGRTALFWVALAGLMVPAPILVVPLFLTMSDWHLINTYGGIVLPQLVSPIGLFIMKQFFDELPVELDEAALIDGANRFTMFWRIALPLSRPALAAVGIFTFLGSWNNFLWPLIVETSASMSTLPIGLGVQIQSSFGVQYAHNMAAAILGSIPILIVFIVFQRQIIEGVSRTGLKG